MSKYVLKSVLFTITIGTCLIIGGKITTAFLAWFYQVQTAPGITGDKIFSILGIAAVIGWIALWFYKIDLANSKKEKHD